MPFKPAAPSTANRGKEEEKAVNTFLTNYSSKHAKFDFLRYPDARTAGGRMPAMPADFEFFMPFVHGLIEIKAIAHPFRLPRDKFSQLATMKKRALAGGKCFLLVHHTVEDNWRICLVDEMDQSLSSWDLSALKNYDSAASALLSTGVF